MKAKRKMDAAYICTAFDHIKHQKSSAEKDDVILNLMAQAEQMARDEKSAWDTLNIHYEFLGEWCEQENPRIAFIREALFEKDSITEILFYRNPAELELIVVARQTDSETYRFVSNALVRYEDEFKHGAHFMLLTPEETQASDVASAWRHYKNNV